MTRKVPVQVLLEPDQVERLDALSKRTRVPKSEIMRQALERHLTARDLASRGMPRVRVIGAKSRAEIVDELERVCMGPTGGDAA